jgi:hypothetical protein
MHASSSTIKLYADDAKLYQTLSTQDSTKQLQGDLDRLQTWSEDWLLQFHPDKSVVLRVGSKNTEKAAYSVKDKTGNTKQLAWVSQTKDLGVMVDSALSFQKEIGLRVKKANRRPCNEETPGG